MYICTVNTHKHTKKQAQNTQKIHMHHKMYGSAQSEGDMSCECFLCVLCVGTLRPHTCLMTNTQNIHTSYVCHICTLKHIECIHIETRIPPHKVRKACVICVLCIGAPRPYICHMYWQKHKYPRTKMKEALPAASSSWKILNFPIVSKVAFGQVGKCKSVNERALASGPSRIFIVTSNLQL